MAETKTYDASQIVALVDGTEVADLESIGYDSSKTHEIQKTLDASHIWVLGIGEYSGTVAVKATSGNVSEMGTLHDEDTKFNIEITYPDAEGRDTTTFTDCRSTDFAPGDYELEGLPVYEMSWECPRVTHTNNNGGGGGGDG